MSIKTNNEDLKNSVIISILNHSIDKLNRLNSTLHETDRLNKLIPTQETTFCEIFNTCYNRLKKKSNNIVTYNPNTNNYTIKLAFHLSQFQDTPSNVEDFVLTENEFIKLIIDSILFAMFKYRGNTVWTRDLNDNSVLVSNAALRRHYHNLMAKLGLYLFEPQELSIKLQQLADDYSREPVEPVEPVDNIPLPYDPNLLPYDPTKLPYDPTKLPYDPTLLPRPKTPDQGWPSLRKGGTNKRKRKYSPTKSSRRRRNKRKSYSIKRRRIKCRSK